MKILKFPNSVLLQPCEEVVSFDAKLLKTLDIMWTVMKDNNGIGLAANQLGISKDMFVMNGPKGRLNFINPFISASSVALANLKEGCLSAPGEFVIVPARASWVQVRYQDEKGDHQTAILKDIYAVCSAHEIEHLDGKSFMQHSSIGRTARKNLQKKWGLK